MVLMISGFFLLSMFELVCLNGMMLFFCLAAAPLELEPFDAAGAAFVFEAPFAAGAVVAAGGVAANAALRQALERLCGEAGVPMVAPPQKLCTDNGAMIAWAGIERLRLGLKDGLDAPARPRWPLDPKAERALNNKA